MMMMLMMIITIIVYWLRVWKIRLQVTNNLVTALSYSQACSLKKQSVDLILILPLRQERYAVLSGITNK